MLAEEKEFKKIFKNEKNCISFLMKEKNKNKCPICNSNKIYMIKNRIGFECINKHKISPIKGTVFEGSRLSIYKWFFAIYLLSFQNLKIKDLQEKIDVTYKTAWRVKNELKDIIKKNRNIKKEKRFQKNLKDSLLI